MTMRGGGVAFGLVGLLALSTLVACGGDDDGGDVSAEAEPYVDSLKSSMTSDDEDLRLTDGQADCMAPRWIDAIGVDTLESKGITPDDIGDDGGSDLSDLDLTEQQGNALVDSFGACDVSLKDIFITGFDTDGAMSDEDRECLEDALPDDLVKQLMVTTLTAGEEALQQDQDLMSKMFTVFAECPGAVPGS